MAAVKAYIGFGANLGDREGNITSALHLLAHTPGIRVEAVSSLYESEPIGPKDQPWFLNGVVRIETELEPLVLLERLQAIEDLLGRQRGVRWGPRTIDLDLLLYGDLVMDTPRLTIPHPQLRNRGFVLRPLVELDPSLVHPLSGERLVDLLARLGSSPLVRPFKGPILP